MLGIILEITDNFDHNLKIVIRLLQYQIDQNFFVLITKTRNHKVDLNLNYFELKDSSLKEGIEYFSYFDEIDKIYIISSLYFLIERRITLEINLLKYKKFIGITNKLYNNPFEHYYNCYDKYFLQNVFNKKEELHYDYFWYYLNEYNISFINKNDVFLLGDKINLISPKLFLSKIKENPVMYLIKDNYIFNNLIDNKYKTYNFLNRKIYRNPQNTYLNELFKIDLIDICNLKCNNCLTYSNLENKNYIISLENLNKLFSLIKKLSFFNNSYPINLIGGEPTLHPDLFHIIYLTRKEFPLNDIFLCTNGLRLNKDIKFRKKFERVVNENKIKVFISYPVNTEIDLNNFKFLYSFQRKEEFYYPFFKEKKLNTIKYNKYCLQSCFEIIERNNRFYFIKCTITGFSYYIKEYFKENYPKYLDKIDESFYLELKEDMSLDNIKKFQVHVYETFCKYYCLQNTQIFLTKKISLKYVKPEKQDYFLI